MGNTKEIPGSRKVRIGKSILKQGVTSPTGFLCSWPEVVHRVPTGIEEQSRAWGFAQLVTVNR